MLKSAHSFKEHEFLGFQEANRHSQLQYSFVAHDTNNYALGEVNPIIFYIDQKSSNELVLKLQSVDHPKINSILIM